MKKEMSSVLLWRTISREHLDSCPSSLNGSLSFSPVPKFRVERSKSPVTPGCQRQGELPHASKTKVPESRSKVGTWDIKR